MLFLRDINFLDKIQKPVQAFLRQWPGQLPTVHCLLPIAPVLYTVDLLPKMRESRNSTMNMKNRIFAMEAAPEATPPNPKIAAIMATIRNITVQRNIAKWFKFNNFCFPAMSWKYRAIARGMKLVMCNQHWMWKEWAFHLQSAPRNLKQLNFWTPEHLNPFQWTLNQDIPFPL